MCGISGYMDLKRGVNCRTLAAMNRVIRHRGPDDEGYELIGNDGVQHCRGKDSIEELQLPDIHSENGRKYFLAFGHRRLRNCPEIICK